MRSPAEPGWDSNSNRAAKVAFFSVWKTFRESICCFFDIAIIIRRTR
jgi:hypothetical protein